MKQKDLVLILVMVFIGAAFALLLSRLFFASAEDKRQTAETVDAITADFPAPSPKYFNAESINPTQQIEIGGSSNPNPFNTKTQ